MKIKDIIFTSKSNGEPFEPYIVVFLSEDQLTQIATNLLTEGAWRPSGVGDLWVRVNPPKPQMNLPANAHVAHKKHLTARNKQVSWEADTGKRHDQLTFDTSFSPMEKAKVVARTALGLPDNFVLEQLDPNRHHQLLLEAASTVPVDCIYLLTEAIYQT